jgi:hypothetical protein
MPPIKCVVVVAHPRSGTHLTIDFIRRNFPTFNRSPHLWQGASYLFCDLDRPQNYRKYFNESNRDMVLKTHKFAAVDELCTQIRDIIDVHRVVFVYPFRQFSSTMKSLAEFNRFEGTVGAFLETKERYFDLGFTVAECAERHAESWMSTDAIFLNVDEMTVDPDMTATRLEAVFDEPAMDLKRRLPRKKRLGGGKFSEALERFTGRESTEVVVRYKIPWQGAGEKADVDRQFFGISAKMNKRKIN